MRARHCLTAGAVLLAGLLAISAPGDAATHGSLTASSDGSAGMVSGVTVRDLRGDMVKVEEGSDQGTPAPGATVGDVLRTTFRHTDHRVVVRTHVVALTRTGLRFRMWVDIQRGTHRRWTVGVDATPRHRSGRIIFMTESGKDVSCAVGHRIDYIADVVRVSVPRRCLDTPHRVRFRLLTEYVRHSWRYAWLDNGLAADMNDQHWTRWLVRG
jgi:hypothetical protein